MKIIISPAKKMIYTEAMAYRRLPVFRDRAERLLGHLKTLDFGALQALFGASEEITELNARRFREMDLGKHLSPAILAYDGIQYKYMAPQVFEADYYEYIEEHLRILSGFYGVLRPFDGVTEYRLEMQTRLKTDFCANLYDFWGDAIYAQLRSEMDDEAKAASETDGERKQSKTSEWSRTIINLASTEYSKVVTKYAAKDADVRLVNCSFCERDEKSGKLREKGVYVKMARGEMVRFMAEKAVSSVEELKSFDRLGFRYSEELSSTDKLIFLMDSVKK